MGTIQHHVVIATYSPPFADGLNGHIDREDLLYALEAEALDMPVNVGDMLVGPVPAPANGFVSFILTTDGSKLGWSTHDLGDDLRNTFYNYMLEHARWPEIVEVAYGELGVSIVRSTYDD